MKYKYFKSDFPLLLTIEAKAQDTGESISISTRVPFVLRFWAGRCQHNVYECSSDGNGKCKNCVIVDDTHVMVYFDQNQSSMEIGKLMMEAEFLIANNHYDSDATMNVKRLFDTGVELTDRPDLDTDDAEINAIYVPIVLQAENTPVEGSIPVLDPISIDPNTEIRYLTHNGGKFLPFTSTDAVIMPSKSKTLTEVLSEIQTQNTNSYFFRGFTNDPDSLNTMQSIGTWHNTSSHLNGTLSVGYDYMRNITQTLMSCEMPHYDGTSIESYTVGPCILTRYYTNGAWTPWEPVKGGKATDANLIAKLTALVASIVAAFRKVAWASTNGQQYISQIIGAWNVEGGDTPIIPDEPEPIEVATPIISTNNNLLTITCATEGATILYSLDGSTPSITYTSPITLTASCTIKSIATLLGVSSSVATANYTKPAEEEPSTYPDEGFMGWGNPYKLDDGGLIDNSYYADGVIKASSGWNATQKLKCDGATRLHLSHTGTNTSTSTKYSAFYDIGGNFIKNFSIAFSASSPSESEPAERDIAVPTNAAYFAVSAEAVTFTRKTFSLTPYND